MSHVFDTGLGDPERTIIQNAAVSLLGQLKRSNGGYLIDVLPFGGIVRTYTDEVDIELLQKWIGRSPGIAVTTGDATFETLNIQRRQFRMEVELVLYFHSQHSRSMLRGRMQSDVAAAAADDRDPGLHVMLSHARELMCGVFPTQLTSVIKQIIPQREGELVTSPVVTIWTQIYRVAFNQLTPATGGGKEWRTPPQLLESIGMRVTSKEGEATRPDSPTSSTTIDADTDVNP